MGRVSSRRAVRILCYNVRAMAERLMQILHNASASSASVKIKNAMNPIVKLMLCLLPFATGMMLFGGSTWVQVLGAVYSSLVVLVALGSYVFFMLTRPHMLQSEEYQIQRQALEIIQRQGIPGTVELVSASPLPQIEATEGAK